MIDLTLDNLKLPGLPNFSPEFGTKQARGVYTRDMCTDVMLPFLTQRPVVVTQTDTTSEVQRDSKIMLYSATKITLTLGNGAYVGTKLLVMNASAIDHDVGSFSVRKGHMLMLIWNGTAWIEDEGGGGGTANIWSGDGDDFAHDAAISDPDAEGYIKDRAGVFIYDNENEETFGVSGTVRSGDYNPVSSDAVYRALSAMHVALPVFDSVSDMKEQISALSENGSWTAPHTGVLSLHLGGASAMSCSMYFVDNETNICAGGVSNPGTSPGDVFGTACVVRGRSYKRNGNATGAMVVHAALFYSSKETV